MTDTTPHPVTVDVVTVKAEPSLRSSPGRRPVADERGAGYLAAFIVLFSTLIVAGVGIMVDTARIVSTDRQMHAIALEAAHAGANALDISAWRNGANAIAVDPGAAQSAAASAAGAFASQAGATLAEVSVDGAQVTVTVSAVVNPRFPLMTTRTVSGTASAVATTGIVEEGQ